LVGEQDPVEEELQQEVIKELNLDPDINQSLDLKVVKCHFSEEFQNLGSKALTE
jgi:hypothetical protein